MEINQFIEATLIQIVKGIESAKIQIQTNKQNDASQCVINPVSGKNKHSDIQKIDFDIAVTVTTQSEQEGNGKVSVMGISVGGNTSNQKATESVSRIRFSIPIALPATPINYPENTIKISSYDS